MSDFNVRMRKPVVRDIYGDVRKATGPQRTPLFTNEQEKLAKYFLMGIFSILLGIIVYEREFKGGVDIMIATLAIPTGMYLIKHHRWAIIYLVALGVFFLYLLLGAMHNI